MVLKTQLEGSKYWSSKSWVYPGDLGTPTYQLGSVFRFPLEPPFNVDCTSHSDAKQKICSMKWLGNPMKKFMVGTALVERDKPEVEE